MKKLLLKSLIGSLVVSAFVAIAYSAEIPAVVTAPVQVTVLEKLKSLKLDELKTGDEKTRLSEEDMRKQDEVFKTLEEAVSEAIKSPDNSDLQSEIMTVTVVLLKKDPTQYAAEVILPIYEKNRKGFDAALKKLSTKDSKMVKKAVKNAAREKKSGNG